ncbi:MAG: hypothetical protein EOO50_01260 [Flavobacterium sp.]|uniref:hypothetical protein n=1 Tax=Flavobacterium sp. TaxID=239 RepID=UPI0011FD78D7|nr:hypothetical protein [Flavobacterium sp.]RZJ68449.1 MAG: hypothetical protein EOO50_01260 [Flavobacterium sp.]
MDRRNFLSGTAKIFLVTSGLLVSGNLLSACSNDDDGGYYDDDGYYDDRQLPKQQQPQSLNGTQGKV